MSHEVSMLTRLPFLEGVAMPVAINPVNVQKMEFNVTTDEGACRVTIVSGKIQIGSLLQASATSQELSVRTLVEPTLAPGQFRKAVATASFGVISFRASSPTAEAIWEIAEVQATLDDETGRIQLVIVIAGRGNATTIVEIEELQFQVTTLARTA
jgi:hypothetical protein